VPPQDIYGEGDGSFEFHRTVSRLMEMQSEKYVANRARANRARTNHARANHAPG
jgi:cell division protein ZapE